MYWSIFKFRTLFKMCPDSSVGSTLDIFPLLLVDQRGREFESTLRNNFFWPFFSASNYIIFHIYVICVLYSTWIRSQKVWVVYVYYKFILEQCAVFKVEIVKNVEKPSDLICLYQILFVLEKVRKKVHCDTHCIV